MTLQSPRRHQARKWQPSGEDISLVACATILLASMLAFTLACLPIAVWVGGSAVVSLVSATGICVTPGVAALAISHHFSATGRQLAGMLLAMGCRLLPPLVVCLWLALNKSAPHGQFLESQVFAGFLIAAYLVSLAVETFLSVRAIPLVQHGPRAQQGPRD